MDPHATRKHRAPSSKPPFTFGDLKRAVPPHCFQRSLPRSIYYITRDLLSTFILYYIASNYIPLLPRILQCLAWPTYWFTQSCSMFSLWIIAHECGHHAISDFVWVDDTIGFVLHSCLLVPYFSWKLSHARHHANTGSVDKDEVFVVKKQPPSETKYIEKPVSRVLYIIAMLTFGLPLYLTINVSGRQYDRFASHFDPYSPIYAQRKRFFIALSTIGVLIGMCGLYHITSAKGILWVMMIYGVPLWLTNGWLVTVTYLQHTHPALPHYDTSEWNWLRGALSTVDRDYGILNHVFHHLTDTHIAHHLFPALPHYHATEATKAIKPILGEFYQYDATPFPKALYRMMKECLYVAPDEESKGIFWFTELSL